MCKNALQAIVVTTADWDTHKASLQLYERKREGWSWDASGVMISAVVGRNGMAWGSGIHPRFFYDGPVKRESDGKSPAGVFLLKSAFGYAPAAEVSWIRLPYRQATEHLLCVDDIKSPYYNRIVDAKEVRRNWSSCEQMRRQDEQYRLGVIVEHNTAPTIPGQGSCIFMHTWKGPAEGTGGCTAMEARHLEQLLRWLNPDAMPILIQMTESQYIRHRSDWHLP